MKKSWKGLVAGATTLAMAIAGFAGTSSAMAYEISGFDTTTEGSVVKDHTLGVYQIFKGTNNPTTGEDGATTNVLTNIDWAEGVNSSAFLTALQASNKFGETNPFAEAKTAEAVAKILGENKDLAAKFASFAADNKSSLKEVAKESTLTSGYYVVVDTTATPADGTAKNAPVLLPVYAETNEVEIDTKTDAPTLEKKVSEGEGDQTKWNDAADHEIGEVVYFKLTATIGDMKHYDTYNLTAWDQLSDGLTYLADPAPTVTVTSSKEGVTLNPTFKPDGQKLSWDFGDIKAAGLAKDDTITITYAAQLNAGAVVGAAGNPNEAWLEYSNDPNSEGTGTTPKDKVTVFTYKLTGTKTEKGTDTGLAGAQFVLKKGDKFYKVTNGIISWVDTQNDATVLTSNAKGDIPDIVGLESGTYSLVETAAPAGYNKLENPISIIITGKVNDDKAEISKGTLTADTQTLTELVVTIDGVAANSNVTTATATYKVENSKGSSLPSTGGMGTTILYTVGALIVLAAGAGLAITMRRRNA